MGSNIHGLDLNCQLEKTKCNTTAKGRTERLKRDIMKSHEKEICINPKVVSQKAGKVTNHTYFFSKYGKNNIFSTKNKNVHLDGNTFIH